VEVATDVGYPGPVADPNSLLELSELSIFGGLSPVEIQPLVRGSSVARSKHHELLFRAGDPAAFIALVLRGAYKLYRHDVDGNEAIMHFASPGDTIGALVMLHPDGVFPVNCASIGISSVLKIPRETYVREWAGNAALQARISRMLYQRMNHIQDEKARQRQHLDVKVSNLLLTLLDRYSKGSARVLPVPITRQEIADSVGATVESVIRLMSEWAAEGILRTEDHHIEVLGLDRLVDISKGNRAPEGG